MLNAISNLEKEVNGVLSDIKHIKSAKATITQPTDNQLLTWDEDLSMVEDSLWQLPAADGAANEIIYTDGAGNLGWIAPGAAAVAGANTQIQYNAAGVMGAEAAFTYNYNTNTMTADHIQATIDFTPDAADGATLGTAALEFSDLYLADSSVIYFGNDQDVTLTHIPDTGVELNLGLGIGVTPNVTTILKTYRDDASTIPIVEIEQDGTGDAAMFFQLTGGQAYTIGIDNSNSDYFNIRAGTSLGNNGITIDANNNVGIGAYTPISPGKFSVYSATTNVQNFGLYGLPISSSSVNGNHSVVGFYGYARVRPDAGITNTGVCQGINGAALLEDIGTISSGAGIFAYAGDLNFAGTWDELTGITIRHLRQVATETWYADLKIEDASTGGLVINDWCIYSEHDAPSRLINDLQFDTDSYGTVYGDGQDAKIYHDGSDLIINSLNITANDEIHFTNFDFYIFDNPLKITTIKSGATQAAAGAAANEVWKTSGHASLPDNVLMIGV